jgi:ectoine hydroxylase-related dioxygenase (phytanoyl-CoA dioxygenase family)
VLYLADTTADQGGFQCVIGSHRMVDEILAKQPEGRNLRGPDVTGYEVTPIAGRTGDLLIWHTALLHGNGHNVSDRPRFAQYISMHRARDDNEEARRRRIEGFEQRNPPPGDPFPGDSRRWEQERMLPVELTPLGKRLLGIERWGEVTAGR